MRQCSRAGRQRKFYKIIGLFSLLRQKKLFDPNDPSNLNIYREIYFEIDISVTHSFKMSLLLGSNPFDPYLDKSLFSSHISLIYFNFGKHFIVF